MKVYYLNDEKNHIMVRVLDSTYDPANDDTHNYYHLKPGEGKTFDVLMPEGCVMFIKKWADMVMLSFATVDPGLSTHSPQRPDTL